MAWLPAKFSTMTHLGEVQVSGFTNGVFGIDERDNRFSPRRKAWAVIHLQTGYAALFVAGTEKVAKSIATRLAACADWDFTDPEEARKRSKAVKAIKGDFATRLLNAADVGPPRKAFQYPEERS